MGRLFYDFMIINLKTVSFPSADFLKVYFIKVAKLFILFRIYFDMKLFGIKANTSSPNYINFSFKKIKNFISSNSQKLSFRIGKSGEPMQNLLAYFF